LDLAARSRRRRFGTRREEERMNYGEEKLKAKYGDEKSAKVTWVAVTNGLWKSFPVGVATCSGVWYANANSKVFARSLGPSGKVALAVSPWLAAWSYFSEVGIGKALDANLAIQDSEHAETEVVDLPLELRAANYFYENTLAAYLCVVLPIYASILGHELSKPRPPGWQLSHAIIHTRVLGQAAAVGSLIAVFGGREVLKKNGAPFGKRPQHF